ncbi:hypothetical protein PTKU64_85260 [Paraburkholderia terrae]|uniref:Glycine zipper family protein n=1 Tax=Paraburkholderia terrae TaxID=311230 RepID=A0ABM7U103_9BURK|nr:hypothetical protein PTKU64_85260 [Paraburkholderia terrae]BDC44826.1 hypothetical protein PTKU15_81230 [Paraburkholderia terrae]
MGVVSANQAATASAVASAAIGTGLDAAAGAAFNRGSGPAVGAGVGLLVGSAFGTNTAQGSAYNVQRRYDYVYLQCMHAAGDRIPVRGHMMVAPGVRTYAPPPPPRGLSDHTVQRELASCGLHLVRGNPAGQQGSGALEDRVRGRGHDM